MPKNILTVLVMLLSGVVRAYDMEAVADRHIVPAYQLLDESSAVLHTLATDYCADLGGTDTAALRAAYHATFQAWQDVQHLRFGPVQYLSREQRFELWPDKRNTVGRHLARLLDESKGTAAGVLELAGKSVAVQGLSGLEYLLFGAIAPASGACRVIVAITANLHTMATEVVHDWIDSSAPYRDYFARPGANNPVYDSHAAVANQLFNSLHTQLEFVLTQKLGQPLGANLQQANGRRAEAWRSGGSRAAIAHNLNACRALYRIAFAPDLTDRTLDSRIEAAFDRAQADLAAIDRSLAEAVSDPSQRAQLEILRADIATLKQHIARDLGAALGLSLGFNSLDGD